MTGLCKSKGMYSTSFNGGLCNFACQALHVVLSAGKYCPYQVG